MTERHIFRLETEHTVIREFELSDIDGLFDLYSDPRITEFMEELYPYEEEIEYQKKYIENIYGIDGYGLWVVTDKDSGRLIGRCGVENREGCADDEVELSYVLTTDVWGRGLAYEVCSAVIKYTADELRMHSVIARIHPDNLRSVKLAKRLGFELTDKMEGDESVWRLML